MFPVWISIFIFIILAVVTANYLRKRSKARGDKLPPGPRKLPIIGNLHQLAGQLPHHIATKLSKEYGPVMHLQLGEISAVVISSPEAAKEVLTTHDMSFCGRPKLFAADIFSYNYLALSFTPYGHYWRQIKKICVMEFLSSKRVLSFRSVREEEVWSLMRYISQCNGVSVNLSQKIFSLTNDITAQAAFGNKFEGKDELLSLVKEARKFTGGFDIADLFPSLGLFLGYITGLIPAIKKLHGRLDKFLDYIVNDHKARSSQGEDNVIDFLLKLAVSEKLDFDITTNHIKAIATDMFSGGIESTSATIEWVMTELVRNPRVMKKAQAELRQALEGKSKIEEKDLENLHYMKAVVKETLRIHPPGTMIPRESRERCVMGGYDIPARTKIIINAWAIGRDPSHWVDPESFRPERFEGSSVDFKGTSFEYLPFGGGRRICPGISYGLATVELAVSQLLYHFDWKMANGGKPEELDATELFALATRRKNDLHLIPITCVPFLG